MKYGIISDIHGNYEACRKVLAFLFEQKAVDRVINCGDIVGYGPRPNECADEIRKNEKVSSIIGNHDFAVLKSHNLSRFNAPAAETLCWTLDRLTSENIAFLAELKYSGEENGFMFVHGSPRNPINEYVLSVSQAEVSFSKMKKSVCFIGHTHSPSCFHKDEHGQVNKMEFRSGAALELKKDHSYIINVGSVGQPRDGNPKSSCATYDTESNQVRLFRIDYEFALVQNLMKKLKLPDFLCDRLARGL